MTSITLKVKASDSATKEARKVTAARVFSWFGSTLPTSRLLCFLDDQRSTKGMLGDESRGFYMRIHDSTPLANLPDYVQDCIYVDDQTSFYYPRVVDDLVYVHGRTCDDEVGLTMTLAHELQHAIQRAIQRHLWAANSLASKLKKETIDALRLRWCDIPIETEARIISKRVAESLFGYERTRQYINWRIAEQLTEADVADWQFVSTLEPWSSIDLVRSTQRLFERLSECSAELHSLLQDRKSNPDFDDIDLNALADPDRSIG